MPTTLCTTCPPACILSPSYGFKISNRKFGRQTLHGRSSMITVVEVRAKEATGS